MNKGTKVFEEGKRQGTQVTHDPGKNDLKDLHRPRVVTFKSGGAVKSFMARDGRKCRATGGPIYSPAKGDMGPDLPGGAAGGEARLKQASRAKRNYHGPER